MGNAEIEENGQGKYSPPSKEELDFGNRKGHRGVKIKAFGALVAKQIEGIPLGVRPAFPKGLGKAFLKKWRGKVWGEWLEFENLHEKDLVEGREYHSAGSRLPDIRSGASGLLVDKTTFKVEKKVA